MQCYRPQNAYFDYGCYYELKDYFDKINITDRGNDLLKEYKEPKTAKREIFQSRKKLFSELVTRLAGDDRFSRLGTGICCKYINYWLHDRIASEFTDLDGSHFIVFRDFINKYIKSRGIVSNYKEKCEDFIQPLFGTKKYTRMRMLYQIYSSYKEIKEFVSKDPYDKRICSNLALIVKNYNDLLRDHKGDLYLNNRLEFFKDLLLSENRGYYTLCDINLEKSFPKPVIPKSHLNYYTTLIPMLQGKFTSNIEMPTKLPTKVLRPTAYHTPRNTPRHTVQPTVHPTVGTFIKHQETLTEEPQQQAKLVESAGREETEEIQVKKELEEILGDDMQETLGREMAVTIKKQLEELAQNSVEQSQEEVSEQFREGLQVDGSDEFVDSAHRFNEPDSSHMHLSQYRDSTSWPENTIRNNQLESLKDNEGFFGNVKSTFSSIAEHVEPAPILGVSGGMGVLFLLFKYTPVGTMFRGRGIRRRIPGSFGGEYSGFIPSFQGYEDGYYPSDRINISYGLE